VAVGVGYITASVLIFTPSNLIEVQLRRSVLPRIAAPDESVDPHPTTVKDGCSLQPKKRRKAIKS